MPPLRDNWGISCQDQYLSTTSTITTTTIWLEWNIKRQTSTLAYTHLQQTQTAAWYNWNMEAVLGRQQQQLGSSTLYIQQAPPILTAAQIAEQERRRRENDETLRRLKLEKEIAAVRARRLLTSHLSDEQRDELAKNGYFTVRPISGRPYRIRQGYSRNIDLVDIDGKKIYTLCAHPGDMSLPNEDHMLAQALHLLHNEDEFLAIANRS